jgi:hypothetical protein
VIRCALDLLPPALLVIPIHPRRLFLSLLAVACACQPAMAAEPGPEEGVSLSAPRKKHAGDLSYRTVWRMQKRVDSMRPRQARLISPSLRLSVKGMGAAESAEFLPPGWGVAIVGKTVDTVVPMQRGGYFSVPQLVQAQARGEDAVVMFNAQKRKNWLDVGWHVAVPHGGRMAYREFGQALDELRSAQDGMPWWDIMARRDKQARFDALRACFTNAAGKILVGGAQAGTRVSRHCAVLPFDPGQMALDPSIAFDGELDFVTLDNSANYIGDVVSQGGQPD